MRYSLDIDEGALETVWALVLGADGGKARVALATAVHLEKTRQRVLHEENSLILHHLVIVGVLPSLHIIALNDVQKYLLVLGHGLTLLGQKFLCFISELLIH